MTVSPLDSAVYGNLFGTAEMRAAFDDDARLQRMLDVEAALARAQARVGVVPVEAARAITTRAWLGALDREAIRRGTELTGYPIVPLTRALAAACGEHGGYVHWGATTQDVLDTALVLQLRDGLDIVAAELAGVEAALADLTRAHRDTVMAGRTHMQHALPITFGFKCAGWLAAVRARAAGLPELRRRALVVQFGGAVGTLASLGDNGIVVMEGLVAELGLRAPPIAWHTERGALAEVVAYLGVLTGTLAKVAQDLILLTQTEIAEVAEPYQPGRGGSSTMPQKRNPIACELVVACARGVRHLVPQMLEAMVQDHERASGPYHAEWLTLPPAFALTAGALRHLRGVLAGLEVDATRMRANLEASGGLIVAEAVVMALAPELGRDTAHHLVGDACREVAADGRPLLDALAGKREITAVLSRDELAALLDPRRYTGLAAAFVDRVLAGPGEG